MIVQCLDWHWHWHWYGLMMLLLVGGGWGMNNYPNPQYYGSWNLNFLEPENISSSEFSLVVFSNTATRVNDSHFYFIDSPSQTIRLMGPDGVTQMIGVPGKGGSKTGKTQSALFRNPRSIHYYLKPARVQPLFEEYTFTQDEHCELAEPGCEIAMPSPLRL
ncbi:unnamed protein product [Arctogadus glacialis]